MGQQMVKLATTCSLGLEKRLCALERYHYGHASMPLQSVSVLNMHQQNSQASQCSSVNDRRYGKPGRKSVEVFGGEYHIKVTN